MALSSAQPVSPSLAQRLAEVRVNLRADLEVSRHLFRGEPTYILRDPLTFQSHTFSAADYQVLIALRDDRTLAEVAADSLGDDRDNTDRLDQFYAFIVELHKLGLLRLPVSDDKALYDRHLARRAARRREKAMSIFFLRVPVWSPDRFLDRTITLFRPLFSLPAFVLWSILVAAALFVAVARRDELTGPLNGLLTADNLALLWLILIALKVIHEFGHAYACKHFGGAVPEMGLMIVVLTPLAYVDATASWGFDSPRRRIIVALAGMYVETFIAAGSLLAWAFLPPSAWRDAAWQTALLASVVTITFNLNPLMKYDGYFVLCDLLGIPNLRQRAGRQLTDLTARFLLGVRTAAAPRSRRMIAFLASFGFAACLYRIILVLSIAALVAMRFPLVGITLAAGYIVMSLGAMIRRAVRFALFSPRTSPVRFRAVAITILLIAVLPVAVGFIHVPRAVSAGGVVEHRDQYVIHARTGGFLRGTLVSPGDIVRPGQPLVRLADPSIDSQIESAEASLELALQRVMRHEGIEPADEQAALHRAAFMNELVEHHLVQRAALTPVAPSDALVLETPDPASTGRWFAEGDVIARLGSGPWRIRLLLSVEQAALADIAPGSEVELRATSDSTRLWRAAVHSVAPAATRRIDIDRLTRDGGGPVPVDPDSHLAASPYVLIELELLDSGDAEDLRDGMTIVARFSAPSATLAEVARLSIKRFLLRLHGSA